MCGNSILCKNEIQHYKRSLYLVIAAHHKFIQFWDFSPRAHPLIGIIDKTDNRRGCFAVLIKDDSGERSCYVVKDASITWCSWCFALGFNLIWRTRTPKTLSRLQLFDFSSEVDSPKLNLTGKQRLDLIFWENRFSLETLDILICTDGLGICMHIQYSSGAVLQPEKFTSDVYNLIINISISVKMKVDKCFVCSRLYYEAPLE